MNNLKVSLEQWRAFQAVVEYGGFAQAAEQLYRSQSTVSYAVHRLETLLGIDVLTVKGRKAELTEQGKILLQRSRQLLNDAESLEQLAGYLQQGWEAEVRVSVEAAFPTDLVMTALQLFANDNKTTRIRLNEVVLSGAEQALLSGNSDLVISPFIPQGFLAEELLQVKFYAVAHPQHPLHLLGRELTTADLERETHIIVSDSGPKNIDSGWISDARRWTVTSLQTAHKLINNGQGFGWLPESDICKQIDNGELKLLPLKQGQCLPTILYLVYADINHVGPATRQFADILTQVCNDA